ncbi:MAG: carbohydrate kinase family protein [Ilumatobacter sp.]|nr:carbohydrate kinase family protein [Ilumatobacter sp.]
MLVTLGDLVDDIVVDLDQPINQAADTHARIFHRRGGSAANVAARFARTAPARFIGQVGTDSVGMRLISELARDGVDVSFVRRAGRTASIVVLVDVDGERTMLVDRGSARALAGVEPTWLDGADVLHLTFYSLLDEPIATTSREVAASAVERGIPVSLDLSSISLIATAGVDRVEQMAADLGVAVVFANDDEARLLGIDGCFAGATTVVKRGSDPCVVYAVDGSSIEVPPVAIDRVVDTTGAGDAFAAGFLGTRGWRDRLSVAAEAGHAAAHALLVERAGGR